LLVATALSVFVLSAATAQAQGRSGACEESNLAVLASPVAPWKGASLRVVFTSEKPLDGELSLVAPDGSVAAKSRKRFGGPPYFWFAESCRTCRRKMAGEPRFVRLRQCCPRNSRTPRSAAAAASCGRKRLAGAQRLGSRHGEPVLGLGREIVRCAARRRTVMAGAA
jgi:hypothetical protein